MSVLQWDYIPNFISHDFSRNKNDLPFFVSVDNLFDIIFLDVL
jgi:hypothetical protein